VRKEVDEMRTKLMRVGFVALLAVGMLVVLVAPAFASGNWG
jgi:hypothetical protein